MLNQDQTQTLQELANIGMGRAGAELARTWQELVTLSVPRIRQAAVGELPGLVQQLVGGERVSAVHQRFEGPLRGETLVLVTTSGRSGLDDLTTRAVAGAAPDHRAQLIELGAILTRACLQTIAAELGTILAFSECRLVGENLPVPALARARLPGEGTALCLEVRFRIEAHRLTMHLVMLMPDDAVDAMAGLLDAYLEQLFSD